MLILGRKCFAVDVCLKSKPMSVSFSEMLCQSCTAANLICGVSAFKLVFSKWKAALLGSDQMTLLRRQRKFPLFALRNSKVAFAGLVWVIIHLHCETPSDRICLSLSSEFSHSHIHPAASISQHIINSHWPGSTGSHSPWHCLYYVWQMMWWYISLLPCPLLCPSICYKLIVVVLLFRTVLTEQQNNSRLLWSASITCDLHLVLAPYRTSSFLTWWDITKGFFLTKETLL